MIGIDVEEGDVSQEAKLCEEVPDNIGVVKFDANSDIDRRVVKRHNVKDVVTVTHIGVDLVACEVMEVEACDFHPCPHSDIGAMEVRIRDDNVDLDIS
ncbi:hypothetical protein MUK42_34682 [Musa troglodytarum]|uniref:Uncharacterized protein n=1 Tax=Musa troglodytarum TaxID=320322 RepID=A0A9E7GK58_9LILI|nr:hypothetical protein MUK42_34682 [Musa troglodytarum]